MLIRVMKDRRLQGIAAIFAFAIMGALVAPSANAATPGEEAENFMRDLAVTGIELMEQGDYTEAEREQVFRKIVREGFALETIGKFVVGRYWRKMTTEQQAEYQELFSEWLLKTYAIRLGGYSGQRLEIVKSSETESRYKDVIVTTRVVRVNGRPPINADWRVRKFGEEYKIIDVAVEGASMVTTQRKEFESVIRKVGVSGLIDNLRKRLAAVSGDTG